MAVMVALRYLSRNSLTVGDNNLTLGQNNMKRTEKGTRWKVFGQMPQDKQEIQGEMSSKGPSNPVLGIAQVGTGG